MMVDNTTIKATEIEPFTTCSYNFVAGEGSCINLVNGSFNIVIGHRSGSAIINQNGQFIFGDDQDSGPFVVGEIPKFSAEVMKVLQVEIPTLYCRTNSNNKELPQIFDCLNYLDIII
jgi:hypothetical protein